MIDLSAINVSKWPHWLSPGGEVLLVNADCLEVLPVLPKVDAVVTDPPYGIGWENNQRFSGGMTKRGKGSKHKPIAGDDRQFNPSHLLEMGEVCVIWGANHFWSFLPCGAALIWLKRNDDALGTFLSDAEVAFLSKGHGVYGFRDTYCGSSRAIDAGLGAYAGSSHPNQKPTSLMSWCLDRAGITAGQTIIDPYCGSGSTLVAAARTSRKAIGIEIDPHYFAISRRRCEEALAVGSDSLFRETLTQPDLFAESKT